jgi:molybdenum cofactor cytidylyltransferase
VKNGLVVGLLLAAGLSTRMLRPKALLDWRGKPLVRYQVEQLLAAGCDSVTVVTGHDAPGVEAALTGSGARTVLNPDYRLGRATSVRAGAQSIVAAPAALVVLNVDQPRSASIIRSLIAEHLAHDALITVPSYGGRRGHPLVLDGALLGDLAEVTEETQGMRAVVRRHEHRRHEVPCSSEEVLFDLNTPEQYAAAAARLLERPDQGAETSA